MNLVINGNPVDIRIVTVELEGEQWGRNYYSIADLIKALNDYGGISAKVDFDSTTKTTIIEINQTVTESVYKGENTMPTSIPTPTFTQEERINNILKTIPTTPDGLYIYKWNNIQYVSPINVQKKAQKNGYDLIRNKQNNKFQLIKIDASIKDRKLNQIFDSDEIIIEDIPSIMLSNDSDFGIDINYYIETIMPIINQGVE
jgi:hypothetical protein